MNTPAIKSFTTQEADHLLGLADQFLEDWAQNEGKGDPECIERRAEWNAIRPLLVAAPRLLSGYEDMAEIVEAYLVHKDVSDAAFANELKSHVTLVAEIRGCIMSSVPAMNNPADWRPAYSAWRHGGWYVTNIRYASGAAGCVSRNYPDGKWRIVCDRRSPQPAYASRNAAAFAERELALAGITQVTGGAA